MSANENVKKAPDKEKDISIPTMEEEIDAWCAGSPDSAIEQEKKKKD